MRIGIFTDTYLPTVDGVVNSIVRTRQALEARGHEVYVFAPKPRKSEKAPDDPHTIYFKAINFKPYPSYRMAVFPVKTNRIVHELGLDIIHSHGMAFMGFKAAWTAHTLKIPLVLTYHTMVNDALKHYISNNGHEGSLDKLLWTYSRWYFRRCDAILLPSKATESELVRKCGAENMKRSYVIPTGINLNRFSPHRMPQETLLRYGLDGHDMVLHVGRIAKEKNLETLIDAIPLVMETWPNARFLVAGDGPAREHYERLVTSRGLEDFISFTGFVPDSDLPHLYSFSKVFTTASTFETQGLVLLEAMASGTPCVGANYRAIPEIIREGTNGFLFEPEDPDQCAEAIVRALGRRKELVSGALDTARKYSLEGCTDRLLEVYDELIRLKKGSGKDIDTCPMVQ